VVDQRFGQRAARHAETSLTQLQAPTRLHGASG
jgi:hypothetical protein